jgi:hypothetical protein
MINDHTLARFAPLGEQLRRPIYADYSFANIPNTVEALLTGEGSGPLLPADCFGGSYPAPKKVVVFLIDSFGWAFWRRHADRWPALRRIGDSGVVTPISALFPSTTSGSITTMNFGVPPARHALFEWNLYIEAYGEVIQTLPFTGLDHRRGDLQATKGYDPHHMLAVQETFYHRLAARGVPTSIFSGHGYAASPYNRMATAGAESVFAYHTLAEALLALRQRLEAVEDRAYLYFYWGDIDSIAHHYGPGTRWHELEIASFWLTFAAVFDAPRRHPDTLFLFTADHGQVYGDPKQTLYLNHIMPELADALRRTPSGGLVYPTGAPRDVFLHLQPGRAAAVTARLRELLAGAADILSIDEALALGLFGPPPYAEEFRRRLGDLLILPYAGRYVWWHEPDLLGNKFYGHHGGLAADEVITVLAATDEL